MIGRYKLILLTFLPFFLVPKVADAVTLFPSPQRALVAPGETVPIHILLDSKGEEINVVHFTLQYPRDLLKVEDLTRGESSLSLWVEEPTVDEQRGVVTLAGGIPNGSVVHNAKVMTIVFRSLRVGEAVFRVDTARSEVYLNDGAGTRTVVSALEGTIVIAHPDPYSMELVSPTHPDESHWSRNRDFLVQWVPRKQTVYSFQISRDPEGAPDDITDISEGVISYPSLTDGVWYFTIKERLSGEEWGPVVRRMVMIDGTPPDAFTPSLVRDEGGTMLLAFHTVDQSSGVDHFELHILRPRSRLFPFSLVGDSQVTSNPFLLPEDLLWSQASVSAVDEAGNVQVGTITSDSLQKYQGRFLITTALMVLAGLAILLFAIMVRKTRRS